MKSQATDISAGSGSQAKAEDSKTNANALVVENDHTKETASDEKHSAHQRIMCRSGERASTYQEETELKHGGDNCGNESWP